MCYGAALKEVCKVGGFEQRAALPSRRENSTTRDGLIGSNWFGLGPFGRGRIGSTRVGLIWIGTDPDGSEQIETDRVGSALGSVLGDSIDGAIVEIRSVVKSPSSWLESVVKYECDSWLAKELDRPFYSVSLLVSTQRKPFGNCGNEVMWKTCRDVDSPLRMGAAVATAAGVAASGRNNESKYGQWKTTGHKRDEKSGHCELQRMHGWKSTADI
ncbi:hypothetical protein HZH68_011465 [Vespula germanica]|uniref:Uncharacterized protein n=1 Tax=Vespula germanica TaxID=30212 RepID=A0A834N0H6_VESGE|nr:hypothetical protein HZH68_011465 [Vespula germanica]